MDTLPPKEASRVLIVEDDVGLQRLMARALGRQGLSVKGVKTGKDALAFDTDWPDLMLLDYSLPDMTGKELVLQLTKRGTPLPFIVTTGRGDERTAVEMMKLGALDYMVKDPGLLDVLPHVVEKQLQQLRVRQNLEIAQAALERQRILMVRSDRLRALGELSAGIAHELNQPLAGIRGLAELLLLKAEGGRDIPGDELESRLGQVIEQVDRMTHIIEHVRMFARSSKHREQSAVQLNDAVESGASMISLQTELSEIDLRLELSDVPPVYCNVFSLEEVVINLITNAAHALQERLKRQPDLSPERHRVVVRTFTAPDAPQTCVMQVQDFGGGIPEEVAPHVFESFFTTKDVDKGTGLGLPICRAIVEENGGSIGFEVEDGDSTIFEVRFPAWSHRVGKE